MFEIKYNIRLNEHDRPCIELPDDYDQNPEDKFFAIEIARYYLQLVFANMDTKIYDQQTFDVMDESIRLLGQIGDKMAEIQYDNMRAKGELAMIMAGTYHISVDSIEERDALPDTNIVYENKIFDRVIGLKVGVFTPIGNGWHVDRYELVDDITNENWVKT
jgi:hypothetical protein